MDGAFKNSAFRDKYTLHCASQARVVGILLAAGFSSRFGGDKLAQQMPSGDLLAVQSLKNLKKALDTVVAIVRPDQELLAAELRKEGARVFVFDRAVTGMGETLSYAISLADTADGWVIALADMPMIEPLTILSVSSELCLGGSIVVPLYQGKRGHPVGFCARWKNKLLSLAGDVGAKSILEDNWEEITFLTVDDPGVCFDIDTPESLKNIRCGAARGIHSLPEKLSLGQ